MNENIVLLWLKKFTDCILSANTEAAKELFDENVFAFGKINHHLNNRENLISHQWSKVWPLAKNWEVTSIHQIQILGEIAILLISWKRVSFDDMTTKGRATLIFRKDKNFLKCIHSHFSILDPI